MVPKRVPRGCCGTPPKLVPKVKKGDKKSLITEEKSQKRPLFGPIPMTPYVDDPLCR